MFGVAAGLVLLMIPMVLLLVSDKTKKEKNAASTLKEGDWNQDRLFEECRILINDILNSDYSELNLNRAETMKREKQQIRLKKSIREACLGDAGDREYLKVARSISRLCFTSSTAVTS